MHIKTWLDKSMAPCNGENLSKTNQYGLKRNVLSVLNSWRKGLSFKEVQEIQSKCRGVLDNLQYKIYETERDYKNLETLHFEPSWK